MRSAGGSSRRRGIWGRLRRHPWGQFRPASLSGRGGRGPLFGAEAGRINGGHLERGAVVPGDGPRGASMHNLPVDLGSADRGIPRMPHMHSRPRSRRRRSNGRLCMLREPPRAGSPPRPLSRCPPFKNPICPRPPPESTTTGRTRGIRPSRPSNRRHRAEFPCGTGIAATARSASLPRLTGLPQFHPEDAERSLAPSIRHSCAPPSTTSPPPRSRRASSGSASAHRACRCWSSSGTSAACSRSGRSRT